MDSDKSRLYEENGDQEEDTYIDNMGLHNYVAVLLLLGVAVTLTSAAGWSYSPLDDAWANTYPSCGGERQSPIDLGDFTLAQRPAMNWTGYNTVATTMTLSNDGHTAKLRSTGVKPRITFSDGKTYQLDSVHFHWGKNNNEGSEHTLCGVRYALEMHAVHLRISPDGSTFAPVEIIVITSFFQNSQKWGTSSYCDEEKGYASSASCAVKCSTAGRPDRGLSKFIQRLPFITEYETVTSVTPFAWSELIPRLTHDFYWYEGSLTTPPCSEVVTFYFNRHLRSVTNSQMAFFRTLLDDDNGPMSGNFRVLQPRNGRKVYYGKGH